jgi:G6PDH family F420-dependent oxidoreductase
MTRFGYTLMTEQNGPKDLVRYAISAEDQGFDFEVSSDHFSPWLASQGHAPNAWAVLGAVAQVTEQVDLYTYVTCPTMRYHPVVVAQQAATVQILADGRFTLGLGSGENLNEHVIGKGWPAIAQRQERPSRASARCSAAARSIGAATISKWIPRDCGICRMFRSVSGWR